jgi:hypothetical protein
VPCAAKTGVSRFASPKPASIRFLAVSETAPEWSFQPPRYHPWQSAPEPAGIPQTRSRS